MQDTAGEAETNSKVRYSYGPPTHGRAKAGRPARMYIQQLCEDTECCPEDLLEAMNDREKWRERVSDIRATSMTWWWWYIYICVCVCVCVFVCTVFCLHTDVKTVLFKTIKFSIRYGLVLDLRAMVIKRVSRIPQSFSIIGASALCCISTFWPGQKCHSKVIHRKVVTHSNGSYERKSRVRKLADEMGRAKKIPMVHS